MRLSLSDKISCWAAVNLCCSCTKLMFCNKERKNQALGYGKCNAVLIVNWRHQKKKQWDTHKIEKEQTCRCCLASASCNLFSDTLSCDLRRVSSDAWALKACSSPSRVTSRNDFLFNAFASASNFVWFSWSCLCRTAIWLVKLVFCSMRLVICCTCVKTFCVCYK